MPITYLRARLVNGESSMRIQAANKEIDACMADAELAFARVFDGSADTCQSMVMDITGLNPKNGGKVDDLSKSASVRRGTAVAAEAGLAMEAQEAAVRVDGALLTALVNVEDAVRAAAGLAGAMQSVRLRSPLTSVSDEGGPTSVSELLKDVVFVEALLTSSKDSSAVAKQGLAVWQKGQVRGQKKKLPLKKNKCILNIYIYICLFIFGGEAIFASNWGRQYSRFPRRFWFPPPILNRGLSRNETVAFHLNFVSI